MKITLDDNLLKKIDKNYLNENTLQYALEKNLEKLYYQQQLSNRINKISEIAKEYEKSKNTRKISELEYELKNLIYFLKTLKKNDYPMLDDKYFEKIFRIDADIEKNDVERILNEY